MQFLCFPFAKGVVSKQNFKTKFRRISFQLNTAVPGIGLHGYNKLLKDTIFADFWLGGFALGHPVHMKLINEWKSQSFL